MIGLTALFWRYLSSCGALAAGIALLWALLFAAALRGGLVLPADAGEEASGRLIRRALESGTFSPEDAPHYVRWARFSPDGDALDAAGMDGARLNAARAELAGGSFPRGFPYANYHRSALLADGSALVLQYDFAMPYADARLSGRLPDFQLLMLCALPTLWALACAAVTGRFTRVLRQDASLLTEAANAVAARRLDAPVAGAPRIREFSAALGALETLRASLSDSLRAQWAAQTREREALAALAHDLRTPLTAIIGHADLLCEDAKDERAKRGPQAILRQAERLRAYAGELDALARGAAEGEPRVQTDVRTLFEGWRREGEALCSARGVRFAAACEADGALCVYADALGRAVINMLDNASRFTPPGKAVSLEVRAGAKRLTVTVCDEGPGFTPEALARAGYALYTQEENRPQDGHRGLGLCLAREAARRHGGDLTLANREEGGARARISLDRTRVFFRAGVDSARGNRV